MTYSRRGCKQRGFLYFKCLIRHSIRCCFESNTWGSVILSVYFTSLQNFSNPSVKFRTFHFSSAWKKYDTDSSWYSYSWLTLWKISTSMLAIRSAKGKNWKQNSNLHLKIILINPNIYLESIFVFVAWGFILHIGVADLKCMVSRQKIFLI